MSDGQKISGKANIPIKEMALGMLDKMFPQLTEEQIEALKTGKPIPPSPDYVEGSNPSATGERSQQAVPASQLQSQCDENKGHLVQAAIQGLPVVRQAPSGLPAHPAALSSRRVTGTGEVIEAEELVRASAVGERSQQAGPASQLQSQCDGSKVATYVLPGRESQRVNSVLDATLRAYESRGPLVTCILVFSDRNRIRRARKAVNQFVAQTYPRKQLVIVNASNIDVTNVSHPTIKEVKFPEEQVPLTGVMRNYAFGFATGDLLVPCWDDDDVYDPHLLSYLVAHYVPNKAVMLTSQLRVNIKNSAAYVHFQPEGIPNTALVPASDARFREQTGQEDVAFMNFYWGYTVVVARNDTWPVNCLKMAIFDGNNVLSEDEFMVNHATSSHYGRWDLGANEAEHMKAVLATFGLKAEVQAPTEDVVGGT